MSKLGIYLNEYTSRLAFFCVCGNGRQDKNANSRKDNHQMDIACRSAWYKRIRAVYIYPKGALQELFLLTAFKFFDYKKSLCIPNRACGNVDPFCEYYILPKKTRDIGK